MTGVARDRSVEDPPVRRRRGQPMQLMMATSAEHVAVHEGVHAGAGDDEPARAGEPCTQRRKVHVPSDVKEWFCSLVRVNRDWTMAQCLCLARRALPLFVEHRHADTLRKWLTVKTHGNSCEHSGTHQEPPGRVLRDAAKRTPRELCQQKIEWTLTDAGITDRSRIMNFYETCCKMLPSSSAGGSLEASSTSPWTRAATSPCSSPPGISCLTCTPNFFSGRDFRRGIREPFPIAADHVSLGEPLDDEDQHSHDLRWLDNTMCFMDVGTVHLCHECLTSTELPTPDSSSCYPTPFLCAIRSTEPT